MSVRHAVPLLAHLPLLVLLLVPALVACGGGGGANREKEIVGTPEPGAIIEYPPGTGKPTPRPNYGALAAALTTPLGPLIVSARDRSPTQAARLVTFNEVAEAVLNAIRGDVSTDANRLHSAIVNVRDAAARGDVATLERERMTLLEIR